MKSYLVFLATCITLIDGSIDITACAGYYKIKFLFRIYIGSLSVDTTENYSYRTFIVAGYRHPNLICQNKRRVQKIENIQAV